MLPGAQGKQRGENSSDKALEEAGKTGRVCGIFPGIVSQPQSFPCSGSATSTFIPKLSVHQRGEQKWKKRPSLTAGSSNIPLPGYCSRNCLLVIGMGMEGLFLAHPALVSSWAKTQQNQRILESWFGLEQISKIIQIQPPALGRDFSLSQVDPSPTHLAWNTSRNPGTATVFVGNLCQGITTLTRRKFFLISNPNISSLKHGET